MKKIIVQYGSTILTLIVIGMICLVVIGAGFLVQQLDNNSLADTVQSLDVVLKLMGMIIIFLLIIGWYIDHVSLSRELQHTEYHQQQDLKQSWENRYWQGISTELVGTAVTVLLLGLMMLVFQHYQDIEKDKADFKLQLSSPNTVIVNEALRVARYKGWLQDGTLTGIVLQYANLDGAYLSEADLSDAVLRFSTLKGASLWSANLQQANLSFADLTQINAKHANLSNANLQNATLVGSDLLNATLIETNLQSADLSVAFLGAADLTGANLTGATLIRANLDGVNLSGADLTDANLAGAYLNNTILPDEEVGTSDTNLDRYTDRNHPDYEATLDNIITIRRQTKLISEKSQANDTD